MSFCTWILKYCWSTFCVDTKECRFCLGQAQEASFYQLKKDINLCFYFDFSWFWSTVNLRNRYVREGVGSNDGSIRPIAYASGTLQQHEKKYGAKELEALGVVWSVKHYLYGHQCIVYTYLESLRSLLNIPHPSGKIARRDWHYRRWFWHYTVDHTGQMELLIAWFVFLCCSHYDMIFVRRNHSPLLETVMILEKGRTVMIYQ